MSIREQARLGTRRGFVQSAAAAAALPWLPGCSRQTEQADVLVAGAGIAGLHAAWLLAEQGVRVLVLEASQRVGGRLRTLDHLKGGPESGGQTLDPMYARTLAALERLGLRAYRRQAYAPGFAIDVNGGLVHSDDWQGSAYNRLVGDERALVPFRLADFYLDRNTPLTNLDDWLKPALRDYDTRSAEAEFRRLGASPEALRLMDILYDTKGLANLSALFAYRKRFVATLGGREFYRISGGSSRLPEAIAHELGDALRLDHVIAGIRTDAQGVEMRCTDGRRFRAPFAIVTIPFSVLRRIPLEPTPPEPLARMIRELPYNHITQVKLGFRTRFWEQDGLPPAMLSDRPYEKVFVVPAEDGELYELNCWIDGAQAATLDGLSEVEIGDLVVQQLEAARPAAREQLTVLDVTAWGRMPWARGSYHFMGPGQVAAFAGVAQQPWGPIHWAGEHTARLQQGIEGAMESAEREAVALLTRLGG